MGELKEGQEFKSARIVPTFTPSERERYIAMCGAKGIRYFSSHLHDKAMAEVEEYEASLT
jgi:hypothetical protein